MMRAIYNIFLRENENEDKDEERCIFDNNLGGEDQTE